MLGLTPGMPLKPIASVRAPRDLLATQAGKVSGEAGGRVCSSRGGTSVDRHWVCATHCHRMRPQVAINVDRIRCIATSAMRNSEFTVMSFDG